MAVDGVDREYTFYTPEIKSQEKLLVVLLGHGQDLNKAIKN